MPNYTTEDLIQFVYQETSKDQFVAIGKALQTDWALKEKFDILRDSMQKLDSMIQTPRPQSVRAILNYASSSAEVEQS